MQQIQIPATPIATVISCEKCKGMMRLVGSEPHPSRPATDLLTYCCTLCEDLAVVPVSGLDPVH